MTQNELINILKDYEKRTNELGRSHWLRKQKRANRTIRKNNFTRQFLARYR